MEVNGDWLSVLGVLALLIFEIFLIIAFLVLLAWGIYEATMAMLKRMLRFGRGEPSLPSFLRRMLFP
jgi:hypothetical protein